MNAVKKYTTFDELKSSEIKTTKYALSLKKHNEFEKVILDIRSNKNIQANQNKPKQ